jgi:hypothetical protein
MSFSYALFICPWYRSILIDSPRFTNSGYLSLATISNIAFLANCKFHKDNNLRIYQLRFVVKTRMKLHSQIEDEPLFHDRKLVHDECS